MRKARYVLVVLCALIPFPLHAAEQPVHSFEYPDAAAARAAWTPALESPPVGRTPHRTAGGGSALRLPCPFSRLKDRAVWDTEIRLDLSGVTAFRLMVYVDDPEVVQRATIYFRSVTGWYGGWFRPQRKGWQTVTLRKEKFHTEEQPAGWHRIDGIRLCIWKAEARDVTVAVDDLVGFRSSIVLVRGSRTISSGSGEAASVELYCRQTLSLLREGGVDAGVLEDSDVVHGGLSGARVALYPYNPHVNEAELRALQRFTAAGGKLMFFYTLPSGTGKLIGVEKDAWRRPESDGQFHGIGLDRHACPALPERIVQGSWNALVPRIADTRARVIGRWVDADGRSTGIPALTLHPNGVFMGHVLTNGDADAKCQMVMALLARLSPDLRAELSYNLLRGISRINDLQSFEDVGAFIRAQAGRLPENRLAEALRQYQQAKQTSVRALHASKREDFAATLTLSRSARTQLRRAWFTALPSRRGEFRAVWCHAASGVPGWSWDRAAGHLARSGFTAVLPNMLWGGLAHYPSELLPTAQGVSPRNDPLRACLNAARKHGLRIHVWKVHWNLAHAPESFVARMRREGRLQRDSAGRELKWLCPSHPDNFALERDSMCEVVRRYAVDGLHSDYIRYPHGRACFCPGCHKRFEKAVGRRVADWPDDALSGELAARYRQWRCAQIDRLVEAISREARRIRPGIEISAAVFSRYPECRTYVAQDWARWVERGWLDFICPMNYTESADQLRRLTETQQHTVGGRIPIYPGLGVTASNSRLRPEQTAAQIMLLRRMGLPGFTLFNYGTNLAEAHLPDLGRGLTSDRR